MAGLSVSSVSTSNIAALANASTLVGSISSLLLATPNPSQTKGYQPQNASTSTGLLSLLQPPPGLLFNYEGEQTATFESDITDHFIEDNTAIQDQIALKPIIITTHGFIAELTNAPATGAQGLLQQATNTLTSLGSFAPALSSTAQNTYNQASAAYQLGTSAVNSSISAISSLGGSQGESVIGSIGGTIVKSNNQNKQQTIFQQLYGYWQQRTQFTIQTPWAIFQNMAILRVRAVQDGETNTITDFEVSFKQLNFASTALGSQLQTQGRLQSQSAPLTNLGNGALNPSTTTVQSAISTQTGSP